MNYLPEEDQNVARPQTISSDPTLLERFVFVTKKLNDAFHGNAALF